MTDRRVEDKRSAPEASAPATALVKNSGDIDGRTLAILPWLVSIAFLMQMLDGTIVTTAIPVIAKDLGESPLRLQAVIISYMLTTAVLIPASGWVADRFGTRRVFLAAIILFSLGSLFCALSSNLTALVASRALQGAGGALLVPVGRLTVLKSFPRAQMVRVLSFITIPALLGPLGGPVLGGFLVQYASWPWIFFINLPLGLLGGILSMRYFPDLRERRELGFDWLGFVLFGAAMVCLSLSLEGPGDMHMSAELASALGLAGVAGMAVYWLRARRVREPLFTPDIFRTRSFSVGLIGNIFARLCNGALPFLTPLLLQVGLGYSPFVTGLLMLPLAAAGMLGKVLINRLLEVFGYRRFLLVNTLLLGLLAMSFAFIGAQTPVTAMVLLFTCLGVINSMQFTAMNTVTLIDLPQRHESDGNSLLSVVIQISTSFGVAVAAMLMRLHTPLATQAATHSLEAFQFAYIMVGASAALSALIFLFVPKDAGRGGRKTDGR